METKKGVLGHEHLDTLTSMYNLTLTWKPQSRDCEALALMEDYFKLRKQRLGPDHPHTKSFLGTSDDNNYIIIISSLIIIIIIYSLLNV